MKQYTLFVFIFIGLIPIYSFSQTTELPAVYIEKYIEGAKETFYNFYSNVSLLVDNDPSLEDAKSELLMQMLEGFDDYKALMKNDMHILGMTMQTYTIEEYLKNLKNSNGNEYNRFIEINVDITEPLQLYQKAKTDRDKYYSFVFYKRKVKLTVKQENEGTIINPETDEKKMLLSVYTTDGTSYYIDKFGLAPAAYDPLKDGYIYVVPGDSVSFKPPFIGKQYFNFTNDSVTIESIEISEDGMVYFGSMYFEDETNDFREYSYFNDRYANIVKKTKNGLVMVVRDANNNNTYYKIGGDKIYLTDKDGFVDYGCAEDDNNPCTSSLWKFKQ